MATDLETLVVTLEASIRQYERELAKAQKTTVTSLRQIEKDAKAAEARFASAMGGIGARGGASLLAGFERYVKGGISGIIAGLGFQQLVDELHRVADIGDLADNLGITTDAVQALERQMVEAGGKTEDMDRAMFDLTKQLQDTDSAASRFLAANRIDTAGKSTEELIDIFFRLTSQIDDARARTALLSEVFGQKLAAKISEVARSYEGLAATSSDLTDKQIREVQELEAQWNKVTLEFENELAKAIIRVAEAFGLVNDDGTAAVAAIEEAWKPLRDIIRSTATDLENIAKLLRAIGGLFSLGGGGSLLAHGGAAPGTFSGGGGGTHATPPDYMRPLFEAASKQYQVDQKLLEAVAKQESGFNRFAKSPAGAQGVMQLMPGTARDLGVTDITDAAQNIAAGTRYLAGLIQHYQGSVPTALAAYNAGPDRVDRLIRTGKGFGDLPAETQDYVRSIMATLQAGVSKGTVTKPAEVSTYLGKGAPLPGDKIDEIIKKQKEYVLSIQQQNEIEKAKQAGDQERVNQLEAEVEAKQQNINLNSETFKQLKEQIALRNELAKSHKDVAAAAKDDAAAQKELEEIGGAVSGAVKGFVHDLIAGKDATEALHDALVNLAESLIDMALDNIFKSLFSGALGGGAGGGGILGSLFGAQQGGLFKVGGSAAEHPVALMAHKGEVIQVSPHGLHGNNGSQSFAPALHTSILVQGSADSETVKALDRKLEQRDRALIKRLERNWGTMSARYQQLRSP